MQKAEEVFIMLEVFLEWRFSKRQVSCWLEIASEDISQLSKNENHFSCPAFSNFHRTMEKVFYSHAVKDKPEPMMWKNNDLHFSTLTLAFYSSSTSAQHAAFRGLYFSDFWTNVQKGNKVIQRQKQKNKYWWSLDIGNRKGVISASFLWTYASFPERVGAGGQVFALLSGIINPLWTVLTKQSLRFLYYFCISADVGTTTMAAPNVCLVITCSLIQQINDTIVEIRRVPGVRLGIEWRRPSRAHGRMAFSLPFVTCFPSSPYSIGNGKF